MALVSWEVIYRPIKLGGLAVLHLQTMNLTLLPKWVAIFMSSKMNMVLEVLKDADGP